MAINWLPKQESITDLDAVVDIETAENKKKTTQQTAGIIKRYRVIWKISIANSESNLYKINKMLSKYQNI
jgi:hypothetical protein